MNQKRSSLRQQRKFSESINKQVVRDIERGKCSVSEAADEVGVSTKSVYRWIHKYSKHLKKNRVIVVEEKSESYRSKQLEQEKQELLAIIGQKQMEVDLLNKLIDLANEKYGTD